MRKLIASILLLGLSGCAQSFYSAQCAKQFGYQKGTSENADCASSARRQGMQESQDALLAGAAVGIIGASVQPSEPPRNYAAPAPQNIRPVQAQPSQNPRICPNGTYVVGQCTMTPNGTYTSGQAQLAPDGSYVAGTPRMAPDGSYVGGAGQVTLCPNGKYVAGNRCIMVPNGGYIGSP